MLPQPEAAEPTSAMDSAVVPEDAAMTDFGASVGSSHSGALAFGGGGGGQERLPLIKDLGPSAPLETLTQAMTCSQNWP